MKNRLVVGMLMGVLAAVGCKPDAAVRQGQPIGRGAKDVNVAPGDTGAVQVAAGPVGSVEGTVSFAGKAPAPVKIDMSMDPACGFTGGDNMSEQYAVNGGKLANVYVYVKSGLAKGTWAPTSAGPVVMDQKGCRYTPHVVAVMKGQAVEFRNSDVTMHNIHATVGGQNFDVTQGPKGAPQTKVFEQAEVMVPVRCNNHPWMNAFINVSETPFFAVSDAAGKFEIKRLPAGTYTLAAVHEKLGEMTATVTVAAGEMSTADFKFAAK